MRVMELAAVSDISERSRRVRPGSAVAVVGRGIEAFVMTLFAAAGWLFGVVFRLLASAAMSLEFGFRAGAGWPQRDQQASEPPPEG
jgi:hypothetical protein